MNHEERAMGGEEAQPRTIDCGQVSECLVEFCEGDLTPERTSAIRDHVVDCDSCRDAVFEVEQAVEVTAHAGDDYRHPDDFVARVLKRATTKEAATAASRPGDVKASPGKHSESSSTQSAQHSSKQRSQKSASTAAGPALATPSTRPRVRRFVEQKRGPLLLCAALALGVLLLWVARRPTEDVSVAVGESPASNGERLGGRVLSVALPFAVQGGLMACGAARGDDCRTLRVDDRVEPGVALRTDGSSLARVVLDDDTEIALERASELRLEPDSGRRVTLARGEAIFDVRRGLDERFVVVVPDGVVEVVGTKFSVRVDDTAAWVSVSRGEVVLQGTSGDRLQLDAGQSARLDRSGPSLTRGHFEQAFTWGDRAFAPIPDEGELRGLGQLRAQKPGSPKELEGAVTLTRHQVRVDLHGAMARTEVEEVFTNHTDDVLEGIYRFPLPPDARIERLALEVDGRWEEGAFVDRDRAAAIWRGAIVNANRQAPRPKQEIIWVPGPWKDPALLEWQGGGRFDLRVFPIPRRSSRRVLLAYSQQLPKTAGRVTYTYPLAHDPGGSTRVDDFSFEVRVPGDASGVNSRGYPLKRSELLGRGTERAHYAFSERSFAPAGDVSVEYIPADVESEVSAWAYEAPDGQRYALLSLRPSVPLASERAERELVFVVDRSRSMFGESLKRAAAVVERTIAELDRDVRVKVLDCDVTCDALSDDFAAPSADLARRAGDYVRGAQAEGASDVVLAVMTAASAGAGVGDRDVHVVYVGDGASSVGDVQPAFIRDSIERQLRGRVRISAVSVGTHVDLPALRALTRAGGGVVVEYNPGRSAAEVAYALLAATYGAALSDVSVSLPRGLHEITPQHLPTVLPGEPLLVAARMDAQTSSGPVTLRGSVGGERFEKSYDVSLVATPSAGNAFVPRAFAAARIADFEQSTDVGARERIVALSQRFGVASRFTSLLVLESPAMFRAFGLDNTQHLPAWDSDAEAVQTTAGDAVEERVGLGDLTRSYDGVDNSGGRGAGSAESGSSPRSYAPKPASPPKSAAKRAAPRCNCPPSDLMCAMECQSMDDEPGLERAAPEVPPPPNPWEQRRRRMVPMRKVWERHGKISAASEGTSAITSAELARRRARFEDDPLRRDALVQLYAGYLLAGELNRAEELVERWLDKDPLDPDALTARADLAAQRGDRALALRRLGSVVDAQPGNHAARFRLARALRWAGQPQLGCRFALASAQLEAKNPQVVARALRCLRNSGGEASVDTLLSSIDGTTRAAAERFRDTVDSDSETLSGDFRVEGTWAGAGSDLDLVIVHPDGYRVSWLGAPTKSVITARDVQSSEREGLALRGAKPGVYAIEVVRQADHGHAVSGSLEILAGKERRRIPFSLDGQRTRVATVTVSMRSTLVPWR